MPECINSGKPAIYALPDSIHAEKYRHLANKVFKYIRIKRGTKRRNRDREARSAGIGIERHEAQE
ncbi:Nucleotide-binding protein-like protein [Operophtera brumata]|uniref:Nucleotide-binding protein-like protein n=1 Tax=Operophtera brumata TaxID=104452 RepID=A0A0L7KXE1_OPEBR|nr:Nucleotide-binding protein-like protein [Operophtera brumata]